MSVCNLLHVCVWASIHLSFLSPANKAKYDMEEIEERKERERKARLTAREEKTETEVLNNGSNVARAIHPVSEEIKDTLS